MTQTTWDMRKRSKRFYVKTYRRVESMLVFSVILNLSMSGILYYIYFSLPEPNYYATDGIRPPLTLIAMDRPNYSSTPILANDPIEDVENKAMIQ